MYRIVVYNKTRRRQVLKRLHESRATAEKTYEQMYSAYISPKRPVRGMDVFDIYVDRLPGDWTAIPERELQDWRDGAD